MLDLEEEWREAGFREAVDASEALFDALDASDVCGADGGASCFAWYPFLYLPPMWFPIICLCLYVYVSYTSVCLSAKYTEIIHLLPSKSLDMVRSMIHVHAYMYAYVCMYIHT